MSQHSSGTGYNAAVDGSQGRTTRISWGDKWGDPLQHRSRRGAIVSSIHLKQEDGEKTQLVVLVKVKSSDDSPTAVFFNGDIRPLTLHLEGVLGKKATVAQSEFLDRLQDTDDEEEGDDDQAGDIEMIHTDKNKRNTGKNDAMINKPSLGKLQASGKAKGNKKKMAGEEDDDDEDDEPRPPPKLGKQTAHHAAPQTKKFLGPQTPRNVDDKAGSNDKMAPTEASGSIDTMNLCNIHYHLNSEHKSAKFSTQAVKTEGLNHGVGFQCAHTSPPTKMATDAAKFIQGSNHGYLDGAKITGDEIKHQVQVGDTIEVHWVFTDCNAVPGQGLGSCLASKGATKDCANSKLRVESQVFSVVDDEADPLRTIDFKDLSDIAHHGGGDERLQTGTAMKAMWGSKLDATSVATFSGSTTGPKYAATSLKPGSANVFAGGVKGSSPVHVTWNVRKDCKPVSFSSLKKWSEHNVFNEHGPHGVRPLVTEAKELSKIALLFL